MTNEQSDKLRQLITDAQKGDKRALAELYQLHIDKIFRYVSYRVPTHEVEDLTADVFVRMVEGLPRYTITGAPFEAWLYQIARARVADYHRKRSRVQHEEIPETMADDDTLPELRLLQDQEQANIRESLSQLSEDEQTLLLLRFVERKTHKEVAEILGKSAAAVRTMQHRALTRLAEVMNAAKKERHYLRGTEDPVPENDT